MKILLTGGSGTLGRKLIELNKDIVAPSSKEVDVTDIDTLNSYVESVKPDVFVHSAAVVSYVECENNTSHARNVNISGTVNVVNVCSEHNIKLIYISTDYAFDGKRGHYLPHDAVNPTNKYAKSKIAGELTVRTYDNSLVIRTSFFDGVLPYEFAATAAFTSKDDISLIGPMVYDAITSNKFGIIHVGTERKSIYDLAKSGNPNVKPIKRKDMGVSIPYDVSLRNIEYGEN